MERLKEGGGGGREENEEGGLGGGTWRRTRRGRGGRTIARGGGAGAAMRAVASSLMYMYSNIHLSGECRLKNGALNEKVSTFLATRRFAVLCLYFGRITWL